MQSSRSIDFDFLADSRAFSEFSAIMLAFTGMPVALFPPGSMEFKARFTSTDMNPICQLMQATPQGLEACFACNRLHFSEALATCQPCRYRCHAGLIDIAVPVQHQGHVIAIISCGQLLSEPASVAGWKTLKTIGRELRIDQQQLQQAYYHAPYLDSAKIDTAVTLITFFAEYLCEMSQRFYDLEAERAPDMMTRAKAYMRAHLCDDLSLQQVAAHLHRSPDHFSKYFKRTTGASFTAYLQQERIAHARRLLAHTAQPIATIAFASGFNSLSQFNRTFRAVEGCTPREFRKRVCVHT